MEPPEPKNPPAGEMVPKESAVDLPGSFFRSGLGLLLLILGLIFFCYEAQVFLVFFAALFIAVFFSGCGELISKRTRLSHIVSLSLVLTGLIGLAGLTGLIVGPAIVNQSTSLSVALPNAYHQLLARVSTSATGSHLLGVVQQGFDASKDNAWKDVIRFAGLTLHGLSGIAFALILGIFLALQPDLYRNGFLSLFPEGRRQRLARVLDELGFTLWWWLMGQLVTMASVGLLIGLGLTLLQVPLAGTLGLIAAILSFIPSLGPLISVVPAVILGLSVSPLMGVWVCLLYLAVQLMESNVITPLVQRRAVSLPPAFVLGSELLMGLLLGGSGLAFATPLAAVVLVLVNMLYIQDCLKEKGNLPSDEHRNKRRAGSH